MPPEATVGAGIFIPHPYGAVIAPQCILGRRCSLFSGVVLGINHLKPDRKGPILDDDVIVYTGAKIIGSVRVGIMQLLVQMLL